MKLVVLDYSKSMANKILPITDIKEAIKKIHEDGRQIVLAGGCFDILHIGHIRFLEAAKQQGDVLIVLLESDQTITSHKGPKRPVNTQEDRAVLLGALSVVDYVIPLKQSLSNEDYDALVFAIKPAIIATTAGDASRSHKERQAKKVGANVIDVVKQISDQSTSRIVEILDEL